MKQILSSNQKVEIVSHLTEDFVFTVQCGKMKDLLSPEENFVKSTICQKRIHIAIHSSQKKYGISRKKTY